MRPSGALRSLARARTDLVETRLALTNHPLVNLGTVLLCAVGLFSRLDSQTSWLRHTHATLLPRVR